MSDLPVEVGTVESAEGTVLDGNFDAGAGGAVSAPEAPLIDLDTYGTYLVPIKVDGVEKRVPLADLRGGYMRQEDYTRKTQAVAEQERAVVFGNAVMSGLQSDPEGTLRMLSEHFGASTLPPSVDATPTVDDGLGLVSQRLAQLEMRDQMAQIDREIASLRELPGFDETATLQFAVQNGVDLATAHKLRTYDTLAAQAASVDKQRQADQAALEAKRAGQPASGHSASGIAAMSAANNPALSVRDKLRAALAEAEQQHGALFS